MFQIDRVYNEYTDKEVEDAIAVEFMDMSLNYAIIGVEGTLDELVLIIAKSNDGQTNITPDVIQTIIDAMNAKGETAQK